MKAKLNPKRSRSTVESLEVRRHLSATLAIGNTLYKADGASLYASDSDGSNQRLLQTWTASDQPSNLFAYHDHLIFSAGSYPTGSTGLFYGAELWSSDGTAVGTKLIYDINGGHRASNPRDFHIVNDHLVFEVDDANYVESLWASDGTAQSTEQILSINDDGATIEQPVSDVVYTSSTVSATLHDRHSGLNDRWSSDGTLGSSKFLYALAPGGVLGNPFHPTVHVAKGDPGFLTYSYGGGDHLIGVKVLASSVESIQFTAFDGQSADFEIDPSVNIPATLIGGSFNDTLIGGAGNDVITGNGGGDSIDGQAGADTITASRQNDTIVANANDTLHDTDDNGSGGLGGGVDPIIVVAPPRATVSLRSGTLRINGTDAADALQLASDGNTLTVSLNGVASGFSLARISNVIIHGYGGNDEIALNNVPLKTKLYGDDGNDAIYASSGKDRIYGGDGADWIDGGDNHDTLYGEAGNDRLFGGGGNDHLDGGAGTNVLRGDAGRDRIAYRAGDDIHANGGDYLTLAPSLG